MEKDLLGNGFEKEILTLKDDYEGEVIATLVRKKRKEKSRKAVLYVHGFIDYFFQQEMAEGYLKNGYDFYGLDLRKYGRSLLPHQTPNFCMDISEYFEELDRSIDIIRNQDNIQHLLLSGHSTGGLITSVYTSSTQQQDTIQALFLNSPFFEFNESWLKKNFVLGLVAVVEKAFPYLKFSNGLPDLYGRSLHKNFKGEWDYNLKWKPNNGFPVRAGWLRAIHKAHRKLRSGLDIRCPILVMHSTKSSKLKSWDDQLFQTDAVLNVIDIDRYSAKLGYNITKIKIPGGMHDLTLSEKTVRDDVYDKLFSWLS